MLQLHNILTGVWCIDDSKSVDYLPVIASYLKGEATGTRLMPSVPVASVEKTISPKITAGNIAFEVGPGYYDCNPEDIKQDAVAIIPITGAITKYPNCENYGMNIYGTLIESCYSNPKIRNIILLIDSPGGEARAMLSFSESLENRNKPVFAYVSDMACSAAMGIASKCDLIIANNTFAQIGCIGTMMTLTDTRKYFEKQGINIIELYADASSEKNKEFKDAIDGKPEALKKRLNEINEHFLQQVRTGRGERLKCDEKVWSTGKTFSAVEAQGIGLIDGIDTLQNVIDYYN